MLSQPSAATAQLSLRLCIPESGHAGSANFHTAANNPGQWIFSLAALGQRVSRLEMPAVVSAESIISEVSCVLPCLRELVLHCSEETDTFKSMPSFEYEPESLADSRLRSVTLTVPPGQPPFVISGHDRFLDLNYLPELEHVLLSGPIVKSDDIEEDRFLFELPLHTKVTVTPGLEGRVPTRWARTQTTYDGSDYEFSIAVPYDSQYMEEDRHARSQRIRAFLDIMAEIAWDQALNNDLYAISDEVRDFLLQEQLKKGLREAMAENRIRGRSELLELALDPVVLVSEIMEEFEETCQNEDDHIMCALEAM